MALGTPLSQQNRPIALVLLAPGFVWMHPFWLRPEEINYTHPTRVSVIQTLGGAYADDFGEGVVDITLTGHTGWHGSLSIPGELHFYNLRSIIIGEFHQLRRNAAAAGLDPDTVEMFLADTLNVALYKVYPVDFRLRRNRQRPLLYQYTVRLIGLSNLLPSPSTVLGTLGGLFS